MGLPQPFEFDRVNRQPLDSSEVFSSLTDLDTYCSSGARYVGQIVKVRNGTNTPDTYIINEDFTYSPIKGGSSDGIISPDGSVEKIISLSWADYNYLKTNNQLDPNVMYNVEGSPDDNLTSGGSSGRGVDTFVYAPFTGSAWVIFSDAFLMNTALGGGINEIIMPESLGAFSVKSLGDYIDGSIYTLNSILSFNTVSSMLDSVADIVTGGDREHIINAFALVCFHCMGIRDGSNVEQDTSTISSTDPELYDAWELIQDFIEIVTMVSLDFYNNTICEIPDKNLWLRPSAIQPGKGSLFLRVMTPETLGV